MVIFNCQGLVMRFALHCDGWKVRRKYKALSYVFDGLLFLYLYSYFVKGMK
jgi:hypothetical protein